MSWFRKLFGKKTEPAIPVEGPKPGPAILARKFRPIRGIRLPKRRAYRKRRPPLWAGKPVSFRQWRSNFIARSQEEGNEVRRSHRERQLEARAAS